MQAQRVGARISGVHLFDAVGGDGRVEPAWARRNAGENAAERKPRRVLAGAAERSTDIEPTQHRPDVYPAAQPVSRPDGMCMDSYSHSSKGRGAARDKTLVKRPSQSRHVRLVSDGASVALPTVECRCYRAGARERTHLQM